MAARRPDPHVHVRVMGTRLRARVKHVCKQQLPHMGKVRTWAVPLGLAHMI